MVGRFDVDRRDVVREQGDLVCVNLLGVLARQIFLRNQPALEQTRDERAGTGKRVDYMHSLATKRLAELGA